MRISISLNYLLKAKPQQWLMLILILLGCGGSKNSQALGDGVKRLETPPVLLGLYAPDYLGEQRIIDNQLRQVDNWAGKRHAIAGFFMDIEDSNPSYNIGQRLERLRQNGYTAFINLDSTRSASSIARGDTDNSLRKLAQAYAQWSKKSKGRMAFIAPFQEMNIPGETYSQDPQNFKLAYQRIQQIFQQAGVAPHTVRWVFAPNGWSQDQVHRFENYYPSNSQVDVVAFSGYNWGYCANSSWKYWSSPQEVYEPYIARMRSLAPNKPIFIAQTATTSNTQTGQQSSAKDQWLRDSYSYLANRGVRAILYFNINKECDWALYSSTSQSSGYQQAVANPAFRYVSPVELAGTNLAR